jgi:hypothetical protein
MAATFVEREAPGHFGGGVAERLNALVLKYSVSKKKRININRLIGVFIVNNVVNFFSL